MSQVDPLNPRALVSVQILGIALCCFNDQKKRWEIAVPLLDDHIFSVDISQSKGTWTNLPTSPIRARHIDISCSSPVSNSPKFVEQISFDRVHDRGNNDWRWMTDVMNNEIAHGKPKLIKPGGGRVDVVKIFVHDGTLYTSSIGSKDLVSATQRETAPLSSGKPKKTANAGDILDPLGPYGRSANQVGIDIESSDAIGRGKLTITSDGEINPSPLVSSGIPYTITIRNQEPTGTGSTASPERLVDTVRHHYGVGDFYQYYNIMKPDSTHEPYHLWEQTPPIASPPTAAALSPFRFSPLTGDCNPAGGDFGNFDDL